jgi:hypothetical protein
MSAQDTVTDDIMAYCLLRPAEINLVRNGKVTFEVRDGHLLVAHLEYEERVGRELQRVDLERSDSLLVLHLSRKSKNSHTRA